MRLSFTIKQHKSMETQFNCKMDLPAYRNPNGGWVYPELFIKAWAWRHGESIAIEVKSIEPEGLSTLGLLETIIGDYNDSPQQFTDAVHDFAQRHIEQNWPMPEPDYTDTDTCDKYRQERQEIDFPVSAEEIEMLVF